MFYFAWVDKAETVFGPSHHRTDEVPFSLEVQHTEGDFASLSVDILNPRVGLLSASRKRWAWVSYRKASGTVVPLFFGRLVGVPNDLQDNVVRLTFVARPGDFEETKAELAGTLRVSPYYDSIWLPKDSLGDPDLVLEGRSALWHVDRVTHEVSISDIVVGEDEQIDFARESVFYDSVKVQFGEAPARRAVVTASVNWTQIGSGDIDITQELIQAFRTEGFPGLYDVRGNKRDEKGIIAVVPGEDLVKNWPVFGDRIGGGWTVGESSATLVGDRPLPPILIENRMAYNIIRTWEIFKKGNPNSLRNLFERAPGFVVEIEDTTNEVLKKAYGKYGWVSHEKVNIMWVPVWRVAPVLKLHWEATRDRTENITIVVDADVQDVVSDPGEEAVIYMDVGSADVDEHINAKRSSFFNTDRGRRALAALIARARAALLMRARCVDVSFSVPFEEGLSLSCRRNASIRDPRLPGGIAAGKVKAYSLSVDGGSGAMLANVTISCSVGRDGHVVEVPGTPSYADNFVEPGYQEAPDEILVPIPGAIGYSLSYYPARDGVNFDRVAKEDYLASLEVEGTLEVQQEAAQDGTVEPSSASVLDKINGYKTAIRLTLNPVTGGPLITPVQPTTTGLKVPRTIDLEIEGAAIARLGGVVKATPSLYGFAVSDEVELAGVVDAAPAVSARLAVYKKLAGAANSNPVLTGKAKIRNKLGGVVDAAPEAGAFLAVRHLLGGGVDSDPSLYGRARTGFNFSGAVNADPALAGDLLVIRALRGSVGADPALTGRAKVTHKAGGSVGADPALTGRAKVRQRLGGAANADPSLGGNVAPTERPLTLDGQTLQLDGDDLVL